MAAVVGVLFCEEFADVADEVVHAGVGGGFVEAADGAEAVDENEAGAVDDLATGGFRLGDGEFETVAGEGVDAGLGTSEEEPAVGGLEFLGVEFQHLGRVFFRVDGDGDEAKVGLGAELLLHFAEAAGHHRAGAGAGGVEKVGDPHFAGEVSEDHGLAGALGEGEFGNVPVLGQHGWDGRYDDFKGIFLLPTTRQRDGKTTK